MNRNSNFGHPSGMFWYDDTFAFIPVPKNASSTISSLMDLRKNVGYLFEDTVDISNLHTFSVVRNPYDRIVSAYSEILKLRIDGGVATTKKLPFFFKTNHLEKFEQFVYDIEDNLYDAHIKQQTFYIPNYKEIEKLVSFENLIPDLNKYLLSLNHGQLTNTRKMLVL
jgi:hypothetical protein